MSRQKKVLKKRTEAADPVYNNLLISKLINKVMLGGKKSLSERIVYKALGEASGKVNMGELDFFNKVLENARPQIEVKPRKIGGATYQVPVEVRPARQDSLAIRWLVSMARGRTEHSMTSKLANEMLDVYNKTGKTIRKKEEAHKTAEANKAFAHFKW